MTSWYNAETDIYPHSKAKELKNISHSPFGSKEDAAYFHSGHTDLCGLSVSSSRNGFILNISTSKRPFLTRLQSLMMLLTDDQTREYYT